MKEWAFTRASDYNIHQYGCHWAYTAVYLADINLHALATLVHLGTFKVDMQCRRAAHIIYCDISPAQMNLGQRPALIGW